MPTLKATVLLVLVVLYSCDARHFRITDDSPNNNTPVREKKDDLEAPKSMQQHELGPAGQKRQEDLPGVWGRSISIQPQSLENLEESSESLVEQETDSLSNKKRKEENVSPSLLERSFTKRESLDEGPLSFWGRDLNDGFQDLWEREVRNGPPGLWGRQIGKTSPPGLSGREFKDSSPDLQGQGFENAPPGAYWGRELNSGPPGVLWGREIDIASPGIWEREVEDGPPGLWGRDVEDGAPGLWGRDIKRRPPGMWGREIEDGPPGLWGRDIGKPEMWARQVKRADERDEASYNNALETRSSEQVSD